MQFSPNKNSNSIPFYAAKRNSFAVFEPFRGVKKRNIQSAAPKDGACVIEAYCAFALTSSNCFWIASSGFFVNSDTTNITMQLKRNAGSSS